MKIHFVCSHRYFENLNKYKTCDRSWQEVMYIAQKFEETYHDEVRKIAQLIPFVADREWQRVDIDAYFVDWCGGSFSHPLTLKVEDDMLMMLVMLTHELLHDMYTGEEIPKSAIEDKVVGDIKTIFNILGIDIRHQFDRLLSVKRDLIE